MKTAHAVWTLLLGMSIVLPALAQDKAAKPAKAGTPKAAVQKTDDCPYFKTLDRTLKPVTLTEDQKAKLDALKKEYGSKLLEAMAKTKVLTPEQKKAGEEAAKAAKAAGKKGKEAAAAVDAAVKKTDTQKVQEIEAKRTVRTLETELRKKVLALLTSEQSAAVKAASARKPKTK